ncbi:MAG: class I SAM-dependent methyltransferase [candidate division Zixibacteria bacterium]|nr:class I SAM-dependent methyltransferase [candidate division Zixibacteria bacterium]
MSEVYNFPKYYEVAFSFRDIAREVDVFEECFRQFSKIPVRSVLEIACGNSPHMEELVKRGYQYNGLDINEAMIAYSREKAQAFPERVNLVRADLVNFELDTKVDFVFTLLDSIFVKNSGELQSHFDRVADVLRKGGLYFLDWCVHFEIATFEDAVSWEMEQNNIRVKTTVQWQAISRSEQTFRETITFEVDDRGNKNKITGSIIKRAVYPQEFLFFIDRQQHFEFVGWWNNWNLKKPLKDQIKIDRPIAVVRRI